MTQNQCKQLWDDLKTDIRIQIRQIDAQTEWSPVEPEWWLQMMRVLRECSEQPEVVSQAPADGRVTVPTTSNQQDERV